MYAQKYINCWEKKLEPYFNRYITLEDYSKQLFTELEELITQISPETFGNIIPQVLGIDARLSLLSELAHLLIEDTDLKPEELLTWIEEDYRSYTKELCGYSLTSITNCSIIYNVI